MSNNPIEEVKKSMINPEGSLISIRKKKYDDLAAFAMQRFDDTGVTKLLNEIVGTGVVRKSTNQDGTFVKAEMIWSELARASNGQYCQVELRFNIENKGKDCSDYDYIRVNIDPRLKITVTGKEELEVGGDLSVEKAVGLCLGAPRHEKIRPSTTEYDGDGHLVTV